MTEKEKRTPPSDEAAPVEPVRPAVAADRAGVEAVVRRAYDPYVARIGREPAPMAADYAALIAAGRVSVAVRGGVVAGILVLQPAAGAMLLENIAVDPAAQGTGLGRTLFEHAQSQARAAGFASIQLYTNQLMVENVALYRRWGFVETHRAVEDGFARVYMAKSLTVLNDPACGSPM